MGCGLCMHSICAILVTIMTVDFCVPNSPGKKNNIYVAKMSNGDYLEIARAKVARFHKNCISTQCQQFSTPDAQFQILHLIFFRRNLSRFLIDLLIISSNIIYF